MAEFDTIADIRQYLASEFGMDDEDVDEMVEMLFESMEKEIAEMQINSVAGDAPKVALSGHAIKGAASNVGAVNIAAIGAGIETAGKDSDIEKCANLIIEIQDSFAALKSS